ncbi:radical SAM family heme chaperone HemW [Christensenellaceae bacterium OttesenSCG-928-M15]|nr:radical SAM family heme chaperone HemW [Christensenellaceae bacterium OttesenSCG-928-M15]
MSGLYVHIPFCIRKCRYCDFLSFENHAQQLPVYLSALLREIQFRSQEKDWGMFQTVFIGGGTPSLLGGDEMHALMDALCVHFPISANAEISMECNPGTITKEKLTAYKQAGINRLSIGIQTMESTLLKSIGRIHTAQEAFDALRFVREAGFRNFNVDVMYGLPGQTELEFLSTLRDIAAFHPAHISCYSLILEDGTPLKKAVDAKETAIPSEEETAIMQEVGDAFLLTHQFHKYEISNYAKEEYTCKHNLNYWHNGEYLGLGLGAHSAWQLQAKDDTPAWTRWENEKTLDNYYASSCRPLNEMPLNTIPFHEEAFETVMLGLRLTGGISLADFEARFHMPFSKMYPHAISELLHKEWIVLDEKTAKLTPRGLDLQNAALQYFLSEND